MTIDALKVKRAKALQDAQAIVTLSRAESRGFTDDERAKVTALTAESDSLAEQIKQAEADAAMAAKIGQDTAALSQSTGRRSEPDSLANTRIEAVAPVKFKNLGEQLAAIAEAGYRGDNPHSRDPRLKWETLAPAGAAAGVPSDGGYLIEKDIVTDLMNRVFEGGELLSRVRQIPIGANSDGLKINLVDESSRATGSRWGGVQVYWGAEADAATAKKVKFRQQSLELVDLIGLAYITDRLLQDATAMESIYSQAFTEEFTWMLEEGVYNGTGAGQPLGFMNGGGKVAVTRNTASRVKSEDIIKLWTRMNARSRTKAVFLVNQEVEEELLNMVVVIKNVAGTENVGGGPVYMPPNGLSQSPYATLMGKPVIPVEYAPALGTSGDIAFVDLSEYLTIRKGGIDTESSIHVRFTTNERAFRWITRFNGMPTWNVPLTPAKGTATRSPYVVLS